MESENREYGLQPIDALMNELNMKNTDLVGYSEKQLSHKVVNKARKGRKLTRRSQLKILEAMNAMNKEEQFRETAFVMTDLFNYRG